ncbi:BLUF domain-containing protein [Roseobacter sp.]|uniref:BLUF domain-containing protein n=1 Tax=Roseobacter sp. TaxID=1907202 RepID=UPI0032996134
MMHQLIYASRPFGYDLNGLTNILATSRIRNAQDDITGALICRPDVFLQLLEGPKDKVVATFARICNDDRHVEVRQLVAGSVADRLFPDWAMKHDPAASWMWSPQDLNGGVLQTASPREIRGIFVRSTME